MSEQLPNGNPGPLPTVLDEMAISFESLNTIESLDTIEKVHEAQLAEAYRRSEVLRGIAETSLQQAEQLERIRELRAWEKQVKAQKKLDAETKRLEQLKVRERQETEAARVEQKRREEEAKKAAEVDKREREEEAKQAFEAEKHARIEELKKAVEAKRAAEAQNQRIVNQNAQPVQAFTSSASAAQSVANSSTPAALAPQLLPTHKVQSSSAGASTAQHVAHPQSVKSALNPFASTTASPNQAVPASLIDPQLSNTQNPFRPSPSGPTQAQAPPVNPFAPRNASNAPTIPVGSQPQTPIQPSGQPRPTQSTPATQTLNAAATPPSKAPATATQTTSTDAAAPKPFSSLNDATRAPYLPDPAAYQRIHQQMKGLRKFIQSHQDVDFRKQCNNIRREIQMIVGQLTPEVQQKTSCIQKVTDLLFNAKKNTKHMMQVSLFTLGPRLPVEGAKNNEEQMSLQFLYLLAAFCKIVVRQWANEAATDGKKADPVGLMVARVFSSPHFLWRGTALIEMLIAKICMSCPVLFGSRGHEQSPQGKVLLGWRHRDGVFTSEQEHFERMAGIAAGYASISLRNFSKASTMVNPYPPFHYWLAMSSLLHTPKEEITSTHFVILRGLIKDQIKQFVGLYGNFALSALNAALVQFPAKHGTGGGAPQGSLEVLVDEFKQATGYDLRV